MTAEALAVLAEAHTPIRRPTLSPSLPEDPLFGAQTPYAAS